MSQAGLEKFTADNPWIFELISHYDGTTSKIPWGSVSINGDYVRYMLPTYNSASNAITSLKLDHMPTSKEATQATKELFDQTKGTWSKLSSMGAVAWESAFGGMPVVYEVLSTFSVSAFFELKAGFDLHASGVAKGYLKDTELRVGAAMRAGKISESEAVNVVRNTEQSLRDHANMIQEGLGAIAYLDRKGWFDTQKLSGLGAAPVAMILGLVAIAAAALVIVAVYQISTVNDIIKEKCTKINAEKLSQECSSEVAKGIPKSDVGDITDQLAKWLVIGAIVAGSVYFLPVITRSVLKAQKELKA